MKAKKVVNIFTNISKTVSKTTGRAGLVLRKKSPELLLAAGVVGFVGTVVLACRATLKADDVLDAHKKKLEEIDEAYEIAQEKPDEYDYDENLYHKDLMAQRAKAMVEFIKLYGPSVALGSVSIACILTSRNILNKRYLGAVSAYNAISEAFRTYRKRVVDEYGEKLDKHFRYGTTYRTETETEVDENGKKQKKKVDVEDTPKQIPSETAVFFDESNPNWDRNHTFNLSFLRAQQNYANDILHTRGHLFLNEVYDMLGFKHTSQGAVIGWIMGAGDDCVDFGLYDAREESRKFINGQENVILLDFNHDGVIWDNI